jgi:hypothetical protein
LRTFRPTWLAGLALAATTAVPAVGAELSGRVRDAESGEAVGHVTVQAKGRTPQGGTLSRGVMALADGTYLLTGLPVGRYSVRFSRIGYEALEDSVVVREDRTYTLDVSMKILPVPVEEILVEADRYAAIRDVQPGFVSLEVEALADLPGVVEPDPIRALELLPGVQTASDFSSGLYIRGGGPDQTLVLLDFVPVYNPTHAFGFFSTFNADALEDVNLYKGAYPAEYGGRLGAVLDVRSRDGSRAGVDGRVGVSTIAARATVGGPVRGGSWIASGRRTYLDPVLDVLRRSDSTIPEYYFYDGNARLTLPVDGGQVVASGYHGRDDLRLDLDADNALVMRWGNTLVSGAWWRPLGERSLVRAQLSWSEYESGSTILALTTPIDFSNYIHDLSFRAEAKREGASHRLSAGLQASRYDVRYLQNFNGQNEVDYHKTPYEVAAFAVDEWRPLLGTVLQGGLRVRYLEDGNRVLWEPRASASRALSGRVRAKIGGGIYHQYLQLVSTEGLSAADFYVPLDQTAYPGRSWQLVAGAEFDPAPAWRASIEGYYTGLTNLVDFNNTLAGGVAVENAADIFHTGGEGWAAGAELFVEKRRGSLTGWVGYTLGWTQRTFTQLNAGEAFPPKYDRRHDLNVVAQLRSGKWAFGGNLIYATGQAFTPAAARYALRNPAQGTYPSDSQILPATRNSARLLPYHRLDLSVSRDFKLFGLPAEWVAQVFNVYNRRNEWFVQYDTGESITEATVATMLPMIPSLGVNFRF